MYTYNQYIDDVINKKLPVCSAAFLAVKRHLDDIEKSKADDYPFYFDENEAKRPITVYSIFSTYERRMGKS
ncbi:hypothetical protein OFQ52_14715 [Brachyspira hyodysenteriae]|uniref:hypothetical protein n=1 Tax=Brachyspira hyodysenteriae TaxID=159 RepID=UPI0022CDCA0F|nr:hypothetical protein [Brachyspira hyodysenteriae]MCZ9932018.1 hypothetical protein [Brachyspira hyodysenteriae]